MITDIPTKDDFEQSGLDFLNLAWDSVVTLTIELEDAQVDQWDDEGVVSDEYWRAAQRPLVTALALAQQGIEFLLKGRIVDVSPFLLIAGSPNEWPRGSNKANTAFADFKTIDAQDLIRVHDTVAIHRLPDAFKEQHENLRRLRNTIMHTVDKRMLISAREVLITILEASHNLVAPMQWPSVRRDYLEKSPTSVAYSTDHVEAILAREMLIVLDVLQPSDTKRLLGFNKRQRRYICPTCLGDCEDDILLPNFAQLQPNQPQSTTIFCFVCGMTHTVIRTDCSNHDCRSNVIADEGRFCLVCQEDQ